MNFIKIIMEKDIYEKLFVWLYENKVLADDNSEDKYPDEMYEVTIYVSSIEKVNIHDGNVCLVSGMEDTFTLTRFDYEEIEIY